MEIDIDNLKEKLKQTGQEQIIAFWDELDDTERATLANQIENLDFIKIDNLFENSKKDEVFNIDTISPIPYINSLKMQDEEKEKYIKIGEDSIKKGELAVISMAGGQRNKTWISRTKSNF